MQDINQVWKSYAVAKNPALREQLIVEYAPLVKLVAGRLLMHVGQYVDFEDLTSYGIFGLIDAIDKYNPDKGIKFETYASIRIRGAIIDNIRKLDWVPRSLRAKNKQLEQVFAELMTELGREPADDEIAEKLAIPLEEARELIRKSSVVSLVSLDDYLEQNADANLFYITHSNSDSPENTIEIMETRQALADAIDQLSDKEKKVITLYYFEELTLKEIGAVLGVSESRISQIHTKAVLSLKAKMANHVNLQRQG
ncbi:MAG: FliA/WhiG family RNA polymerase sigma factor [Clostridiales bacterium]|jgi:RNA polymerase sigma factor for flagellar operon FliA|nr:FliA/WhiG family RNA polymerase sigma factor [Clostridiales bacterium]